MLTNVMSKAGSRHILFMVSDPQLNTGRHKYVDGLSILSSPRCGEEYESKPSTDLWRAELRFSHTRQIRLNFTIALLARPEIERNCGQFIDERDKSRVFCQVNGFEVAPASVTAFDSHAWDPLCGVVGEFVRINLEAGGARDALKGPDVAAIAAHQESTSSFHAAFSQAGRGNIGGEKCDLWIAPAKWAQAVGMGPGEGGFAGGGGGS